MIEMDPALARLDELHRQLISLKHEVGAESERILERWRPPFERRAFRLSVANLASYIALRHHDLRALQVALIPYGLSSLGRCESRVMPTLDAVTATTARLNGAARGPYPSVRRFFRGERALGHNVTELFGPPHASRSTRIMVTLGEESAEDGGALLRELIACGMDCARINSAHATPEQIVRTIASVRATAKAAGRFCSVLVDVAGPKMRTERVQAYNADGRVYKDDRILLSAVETRPPDGAALAICTLPEIFAALRPGARVVFDEGRIEAQVERADAQSALLHVESVRGEGEKLKPEKGLNFPDTDVRVSPLTPDDYAVLDAVANQADMIGYSFVSEPSDVELLQRELAQRRSGPPCGLILKIETARAVRNLPELIVQSARSNPTSVMIARGDLAVEIGYRRLAEIQEELLWICEAASIPVVWATQVLDTFVKKGRRSRAEFTDAAMAERADCVMLNKGPYVVQALAQLDDVLGRMEAHQTKKTSRLRALHSW